MSSFLPPDIVADILSRLPVKPLLRFRCVSKPWCSLIDSSDFVKLHLNQSFKTKSNRNLILGFSDFNVHSIELPSIDSPRVDSTQSLKTPISDSVVMNSCNGLSMCYSINKLKNILYIWNPFTRKYKELPPIPLASTDPSLPRLSANNDFHIREDEKYGFAYVSETDDYKVVLVRERRSREYDGNEAYMFSSTSNQWESLEPFPYEISVKMAWSTSAWGMSAYESGKRVWGAHLNGFLHTIVERESLHLELMVFDTRSKHHSMLSKPDIRDRCLYVTVEVLQGNLCLLHERLMNPMYALMDLWVMKDYGVEDSWFKLLSVPLATSSVMLVYPLAYSEDGAKVLMNYNRKELVWYNLRGKREREVTINVVPLDFYAEVAFETLVSPGFISKDDDAVNKPSKQKMLKEKRNTSLRKGFLSQGFKLKL